MYKLIIKRKAQKQFDALPANDRERVLGALDGLCDNPFAGKKLQGTLHGQYSVRVWPYRILYTIDRKVITITVLSIGHRKDVYRD